MLSSLKRLRINQTKINIKEINKLHAHDESEEIWLISVTCDKFYAFFFTFTLNIFFLVYLNLYLWGDIGFWRSLSYKLKLAAALVITSICMCRYIGLYVYAILLIMIDSIMFMHLATNINIIQYILCMYIY